MNTTDDRYPYTYAALYIIENLGPKHEEIAQSGVVPAGFTETKPTMKMHEADRILTGICVAANLNTREVAERLAKKYLREHADAGKVEA